MKIAILDESKERSRAISDFIKNTQYENTVSAFITPFELVTQVCEVFKGDVDLLIIHVIGESDERIDMTCDLQAYFPHIKVIFYSENCECAENIFEAEPSGFLRVPIKKEKLKKSVERVRKYLSDNKNQLITIKSKGQIQRINLSSIKYIESMGRKLVLYTDSGDFETYMKAEEIMTLLSDRFFKSHRSYIVNLDKLNVLNTDDIVLYSGERIPVARSQQKMIKEAIKKIQ